VQAPPGTAGADAGVKAQGPVLATGRSRPLPPFLQQQQQQQGQQQLQGGLSKKRKVCVCGMVWLVKKHVFV